MATDIRRHGRKPQARVFDALIAATAKAAQRLLYTFSSRDLDGVADLEVVALPPTTGDARGHRQTAK